jgi:hypothetical protein
MMKNKWRKFMEIKELSLLNLNHKMNSKRNFPRRLGALVVRSNLILIQAMKKFKTKKGQIKKKLMFLRPLEVL